MRKYLASLIITFFSLSVFAQTECSLYHKKSCGDRDGIMMKYDSQSKSAILGEGQSSEFHLVAYKGLDYRITVCTEDILGDGIQFQIFEKNRVKIKENTELAEETTSEEYSEDDYSDSYSEEIAPTKKEGPKYKVVKEMLYDNADDGYSSKIEFTAEGPMSLIIRVIIPGSGNKSKLKIREMGCVGVLIEHVKSRKVGF
ncbi:MAG: hypothetical protein JKY48_19260 [Flavobacteriales bacterium]|nr:hypothetical protein [Flavobacteriales bacterium]